ncbi:hypothetical protein BDD12DRAFT_806937 [Trichophaea hybrida]|nr:hypothetical protein BDD12DRAFT_806937 [Trichophaea hybrida]
MSTETHTEMDPLKEDTTSATPTKETGYASIGLALYTRVGNSSHRHCHCRGGYGKEDGRGNGRHTKHRCTHCKLDIHTTDECRKKKHTQSGNSNSGGENNKPRKEGNDE